LLQAGGTCKADETAVQWNVRGPQGDRGATGAQGPKGEGPAGASAGELPFTGTIAITGQKQGQFQGSHGPTIPIDAIGHEMIVSPRDPASGLPTGKRQHEPIAITKEIDKSSPLILGALVTNETLTQVLDRDGPRRQPGDDDQAHERLGVGSVQKGDFDRPTST
jgi:Type VI secretion system effector, Hcp